MASGLSDRLSAEIELLGYDHPDRTAALRIIVGDGVHPADRVDRDLEALLHAVRAQKLNIDLVLGARQDQGLVGACLAVASPGRSALTMLGPGGDDAHGFETRGTKGRRDAGGNRDEGTKGRRDGGEERHEGTKARRGIRNPQSAIPNPQSPIVNRQSSIVNSVGVSLLRRLQHEAWQRGVVFLQALLIPNSNRTARIYLASGFKYLAELVYQNRSLSEPIPPMRLPEDLNYLTYTHDLRERFINVLDATYVESHDCPALSGLRDTCDVLVGHRHTGIHHAGLWHLALQGDTPVGVLLITGVPNRESLEIVYMGVTAGARGRRIGDALLSLAIELGRQRGMKTLTLAVDSTNRPACRLYERWGFFEVGRRRAWISCARF
ncbi:MAG: GNAT family N-acetyltransferase [Phycisphaerae bacterium]